MLNLEGPTALTTFITQSISDGSMQKIVNTEFAGIPDLLKQKYTEFLSKLSIHENMCLRFFGVQLP